MSHDTDKLIRQLSLVAFLMAERRPLTAREIKSTVEGYSEMSDEAFARRFYSDRSELIALGVPLHSQRDEFTGEELYTLRSEQYFLPPLELSDDELAALQTSLYLLEGKFPYAEPLRLALQNLALGRPAPLEAASENAVRVQLKESDYSKEMPGRLTKLEGAISKQRTVKFGYHSIARDETSERTVNPFALMCDNGLWYVVGQDLDREAIRTFRVSRIRGDIRFATRRERDFRVPADFDPAAHRVGLQWQVGEIVGAARIEVAEDTAWWVERSFPEQGPVDEGVFVTDYAELGQLATWVLRQAGRARPLDPPELVEEVERGLHATVEGHAGQPPAPAALVQIEEGEREERPAGPVAPERFALLQALLAHLLERCGTGTSAVIPADELSERFHIPREQLDDHLQLLNLVNFGGGCYTVYASLDGDEVRVEKELFGDTFRRAPRLTPLEARAIGLALEFVGPTIAAAAHTKLEKVRHKLEETFGEFEPPRTRSTTPSEEELIQIFADAISEHRLVAFEYLSAEGEMSERTVEPYSLERELPNWRVHCWDVGREATRSFRLDRMREARLLKDRFEPRPGLEFQPLSGARTARVLYSKQVARWSVERGAQWLADGTALHDLPFGTKEWLVSEILSYRGEATVIEPADLRKLIGTRARALERELTRARSRR